jgi:ribosomal protein L37AE/L43A
MTGTKKEYQCGNCGAEWVNSDFFPILICSKCGEPNVRYREIKEMEYEVEVINKIQDLQNRIKEAQLLNEDLKLCKEILPEYTPWLDNEINYDFACKSISEVKVVLNKFARKGIMLKEFTPSETKPIWCLKGKNCNIRLSPYWSQDEGASCRLIQVGEETRTYPKYKLVCDNLKDETAVFTAKE